MTAAPVTYKQVGTTSFGDPEILVTVEEPHPKAGLQLLMRSTASMDHMAAQKAATGKTSYLIYNYPDPDSRHHDGWHGATRATTLEKAVEELAEYIDWLWQRDQLADRIGLGALREHLDRFSRGLNESSALDYRQEWAAVLEEVARIDLIMSEVTE